MSVEGLDTREPVLDIKPLRGIEPAVVQEIRNRLLSFEFEDSLKLIDVARIELDNTDGALLSKESIALGISLSVSWGYVDLRTAPRILLVKKVKGLSGHRRRAGGRRPVRESLGGSGKVFLECWAKEAKLHRLLPDDGSGTEQPGPRRFDNMRISEVVTEIAAHYGFTPNAPAGRRAIIEKPDDDPIRETVVIPVPMTDAQWLRDQANRLGYMFAIDETAFRFHSRRFDRTPRVSLTFFQGMPDVQAYEIDGDLRFGAPRRTSARGVDIVNVDVHTEVSDVDDAAPLTESVDPGTAESQEVGVRQRSSGRMGMLQLDYTDARSETDVFPVARATERAKSAAIRRLEAQAERKWKLKLDLVGNPLVRARQYIRCEGFGDMVDGDWFTRKVIHRYEAGNVYTTQIAEATRKGPARRGNVRVHNIRTGTSDPDVFGTFQIVGDL